MITNDGTPERYHTRFNLTKKEFASLSASRVSAKLQKVPDSLKLIKREAKTISEKIIPFTFPDFEKEYIRGNPLFHQRKYLNKIPRQIDEAIGKFDYTPFFKDYKILKEKNIEQGTIGYAYLQQIRYLLRSNRIGTTDSHHTSYHSFLKFSGSVTFKQVNAIYL